MCSRFIHVVTCIGTLFLFITKWHSTVYTSNTIHLSVHRLTDTWGYYDVATNICVRVSCRWMFPLLRLFETLNSPPCYLQRPSGRYVPGADQQGHQGTKPGWTSRLLGVGEEERQTVEGLVGFLSEQAGEPRTTPSIEVPCCEGRYQVGGSLHPWRWQTGTTR